MNNEVKGLSDPIINSENEAEDLYSRPTDAATNASGDIYQTTDLQWLENDDLHDIEWQIKPHLNGNGNASWKVSWKPVSSKGKMQVYWPSWRQYGQEVVFWCMHHPKKEPLSPSSVALYSREIRAICEWFCFEQKVASISEVVREDIDAFLAYLASLQLTSNSLTTKLILLRRFNEFTSLVGEGLPHDPFRATGNLAKVASKIGAANGHTPTIYPRDFFKILNSALVMLNDADHVVEQLDLYLSIRSSEPNNKKVARKFKAKYGVSSRDLQKHSRALYGACIVVLLALWGERKHELLNSNEADVLACLSSSDDEIEGVEHKTSGTWTGKRTERAAIAEVRDALNVIARLTKRTREESEMGSFFVRLAFGHSASPDRQQKEITTATLYKLLENFVEHSGLEIKIRPHMFRRSFSMLWAWRFEIGDLEMLSKLLYHNNDVFTRFYTEDEDVWEFLPEAEQELAFSIIQDALTGSRTMTGGLGNVLERYKRSLIARFGVLSPEKTERLARRLLAEGGYRVVANADGFCFINEARGHRAKCSTDGSNPNYANRREELCAKCPNFGVDESRIEYWEKRKRAHEEVAQKTSVPMLADAAQQGVARAEKIVRQINAKQID